MASQASLRRMQKRYDRRYQAGLPISTPSPRQAGPEQEPPMSREPQERDRTAPHPVIADFYGGPADRQPFVRNLFNSTALHYDAVNRLFSFGTGAWYRRRCLLRAGLRSNLKVVDVAVGTGLLAREA